MIYVDPETAEWLFVALIVVGVPALIFGLAGGAAAWLARRGW